MEELAQISFLAVEIKGGISFFDFISFKSLIHRFNINGALLFRGSSFNFIS